MDELTLARNRARVAALIEELHDRWQSSQPLIASDLDAARIPLWRHRLIHAAERDADEATHRVHFDAAWAAIRAEWERAGSPRGPRNVGNREARRGKR